MSRQISKDTIDKLSEVGNIGSGNAVSSLSIMLNRRVDMSIAAANVKKIGELPEVLGDEEQYIAAMMTKLDGDIEGLFLLIFEIESAKHLVNRILDKQIKEVEGFEEIEYSLLSETTNILVGNYLSALTTLTSFKINQSVPQLAMDMAGAILSFAAVEFTQEEEEMVLIETAFTEKEDLINGTYIILLDATSLDKIAKVLDEVI